VEWSAAASFAFRVLARVEDEAGFLPAPLTRLDRYHSLSGEEQSRYVMATVYHTAYVMGLVCAAALRSGKTPLTEIPHQGPQGGASVLLKHIDAHGGRPHWRDDLSQLPSPAQDTLAPMLLTIALRRAAKRRDLQGIRTLLERALGHKLVSHPASRQAAGMLRRIAAASQLLMS
jgi:hypothetical protein